jgi:hypothetical protein
MFNIRPSILQIVDEVESKQEHDDKHPLARLAEDVQRLAKKDANVFSPILSKWHPQAIAISACLLHTLYQKELVMF